MRIAFFTDTYKPQISGVVENVETSAKALRSAGHQVIIVAPKTPGFKLKDKNVFWIPSVKIIRNPEIRSIVPIPDRTMRKLLSKDFDIVHGHSGGPACFLGWEIARRKKIPYVFTYHTLFNRYTHYLFNGKLVTPKMVEFGSRVFCNLTDQLIAPTGRVKNELLRYGVKKPIAIVPGGIGLAKFKAVKKNYLRRKFAITKDKTVILYLGRLGKEKNLDFLLNVFQKVAKGNKAVVFAVVGDGPDKSRLQNLAKELGIEGKVIFTGFVPSEDVPSVYADSDVFVFASTTETQGLVIIEAMASHLPVLAVKDDAYEGVIEDKVSGLFSKQEVEEFSTKLSQLIEDKNLQVELGNKAYQQVEKHFSAEKQAEELTAIYEYLIGERAFETKEGLLSQRAADMTSFLKINERFNRFKKAMRLTNGNNS